jgi:tellurite resistance protein TerC
VARVFQLTYKWARRCAIALVGGTVVLIGIAMIVFPGPAIVVIPAGLAILGLEFAWARRWLERIRSTGDHLMKSASRYWSTKKSGE